MLYDARRDRFPILMRFIAWLRTKPADEFYDWQDPRQCACGQFGWGEALDAIKQGVYLNALAAGSNWHRGMIKPAEWTFGQLLARAEAELDELTR